LYGGFVFFGSVVRLSRAGRKGWRDEALIWRLLEDTAQRLANRHRLVLFTDGEASYASLFPELFGQAYRPSRQGDRGCFPEVRYRIRRMQAHVQIMKHREGQQVVAMDIRYAHGSKRCVQSVLDQLGCTVHFACPWPNRKTKKVRASDPSHCPRLYEPPVVHSRCPAHAGLPGSRRKMISCDCPRFFRFTRLRIGIPS
jgi:hypothetical protein